MKKINIIESVTGVEVNFPPNAYIEKVVIGRYTIQAILPEDGFTFHIFRGDELKAIISNEEWFISKLDAEGQNLLNRILKIYG